MSEEVNQEGLTEEEKIEKARKDAAEAARKEAEAEFRKAEEARIKEIQEERQRRQAAEDELKRSVNPNEDDPKEVFKRLMDEDKKEKAKQAREEALKEFRNSIREMSEDNDPAGIVYSAFEKELQKFNLNDLSTKEDFIGRFKDVHEYMNRKKKPTESTAPEYTGGEVSGSSPKEENPNNLTDVEIRLIKDMGWDNERYLAQKAKRPHYIAQLLNYRS